MMPILYGEGERVFNHNGYGILRDCISCEVTQELNGQYELSLKYPIEGIHFDAIVQRAIVLAKPEPDVQPQPFRIYRITKPLRGIVSIYARHIAYDMEGITASPFTAHSVADALFQLRASATTECPFDFYTDKSTAATMTVAVPATIWSLLGGAKGSLLDTYGGEYIFDRYNVQLLNRRGLDRGVSVRYGKNLTSLEQDENCASCYTGVYPYWTDFTGKLVELPEKIVYAAGIYSYTRIRPLDLSDQWQQEPTEEQLRKRATRFMVDNQIGVPRVSWKIEYSQNQPSGESEHFKALERVSLGDAVSVVFPDMGVQASARVAASVFDVIADQYRSVFLGSVKANLAQTIVQQGAELRHKASLTTMERATMSLTGRILGATGGTVRFLDEDRDGLPDTLYIADHRDPTQARKVWRWNYEGWAGSVNGYGGPFTIGATLEDGLLAEAVTAANLIAGTIKSVDEKTFFLDLDNGILRMDAKALSIDGKSLEEIAREKAKTEIKNQTQEDIFNILSNNGKYDGIWMEAGKLYFNLTYAQAGYLNAGAIKLSGKFTVCADTEEKTVGGNIGYMSGIAAGGTVTDGIGISNNDGTVYVIVTNKGVRLQSGTVNLSIPHNGIATINGSLRVTGDIYYSGDMHHEPQGGLNANNT